MIRSFEFSNFSIGARDCQGTGFTGKESSEPAKRVSFELDV